MKKCTFCAEEIQDEAIKCKHCHEFLNEARHPPALMKKCTFCAEEIQNEATKCKHCHEFLNEARRPPALPAPATNPLPFYLKTSFIVLVFLTMPPFALPSVWLHPKLHWAWKLAITALAITFCWISYKAIVAFSKQYDEAIEMMRTMGI